MQVTHPVLRPDAVEFRGYQANLARIAAKRDTLVVLPTGMGKTVVALLVLADALRDGAKRTLFMAPTRPLVEQHGAFLAGALAPPWDDRVHVLTGNVAPAKRAASYQEEGLVVATPQVVHNDLVSGVLDIASVDWIVFDEAHRAVGDYPYTGIGAAARRVGCRRLGLTASPGHDVRKIDEVRQQLGLEHVEIRAPTDADVAEYVRPIDAEWETLPLPPAQARVSNRLQDALAARVRALRDVGFLRGRPSRPSRRDLLELQRDLQKAVRSPDARPEMFQSLSLHAQAMKLVHAIEQVETQGAAAFVHYIDQVRADAAGDKASKASKAIAEDALVGEAYHIARLDETENPKMGRTQTLVREQVEARPDSRIIVFTHYRTTCEQVAAALDGLPGVRPVVFVGQGRRRGQEGLTQRQQAEVLDRFARGEANVLVATSVAEEGLDIPDTDLVLFYEPIPSEIRSIQRRGRTGRHRKGRVVVLMTKGTQDEAAHWTARRREQQMVRELHGLRATLAGRPVRGQTTLDPGPAPGAQEAQVPPVEPEPTGPRIVCDHREQAGGVVKHLHAAGARLEMRQLEVGDFVVSDRIVVERKTCADFVDSLVDGRLFDQVKDLRAYPRPFLVLEGEGLYGHRNVAPEALMGAVSSVVVDFGVPVLQTKDAADTARFLFATAKREQQREGRSVAVRAAGQTFTDGQQQRFILCGLPGVSEVLAERLLAHFGSVEGVMAAPEGALAQVEGIGSRRAAAIRRILALPPQDVRRAETV